MNRQYLKGALWFLSHSVISSVNDATSKFLGTNIPSFEIVTLRFFFSALTLLFIMLPQGKTIFKTKHLFLHFIRGLLLFCGIAIWVICLNKIPMVLVTLMSFTIPLFFIVLANIFLQEKIEGQRLIITIIGFIGVIIAINPISESFCPSSLLLIPAVICFALLDVINKKFVSHETIANMMFYSAFFTMIFSIIPNLIQGWVWPNLHEIFLCFILGSGANLILYSILKAFSYADATSLSPLRYIELIISSIIAYLLFGQIPGSNLYLAAIVIILSNIMLLYSESFSDKD